MAKKTKQEESSEENGRDSSKETIRALIDKEVLIPDKDSDFCISTGSLLLDLATNGGIHPSILRMTGATEGGKSSCALSILKNFLDNVPKAKGLIIPSEGRLKNNIRERSGVKFVDSPDEWEIGTCLVIYTNVFEKAVNIVRQLVYNNPENFRYAFIIDSVDALIPRGDVDKMDEPNKVSGAALLSSDFLRRMANAISVKNHLVILISQVRAQVKINQYEKTDPRITNAGGGNALLHYSDWIFEFQERFQSDIVWSGEKGKSERLGHRCKILFRKTPNEKTGVLVQYPIKYGRKDGQSVWIECEVIDMLLAWGQATQKGAWITLDEGLHKELIEAFDDQVPKQFNGENKFRQFLEENQGVTQFLFKKFKERLT
jgi:RecA/RadA recombinase